MIVFDDDEVEADLTLTGSGGVGKVMPRSVMMGAVADTPDSLDADSPKVAELTSYSAGVDSVALDTLALTKDPSPPASDNSAESGAAWQGAEQDSMQLFFDDSDMIDDSKTAGQVAAAPAPALPPPPAAAATAPAPPPLSEAKVYGRKNRDGGAAGGITSFFAPAPKVVDPLPTHTAVEELDDDAADADDDADAAGDDDEGDESDADSVDSAASLARRLMEEQRRRQQEAFKVPVAAQVRKDIIDMVGEKGRCAPLVHRLHPASRLIPRLQVPEGWRREQLWRQRAQRRH
jgi:hypothetical protein